jgi:hypothetical protein
MKKGPLNIKFSGLTKLRAEDGGIKPLYDVLHHIEYFWRLFRWTLNSGLEAVS